MSGLRVRDYQSTSGVLWQQDAGDVHPRPNRPRVRSSPRANCTSEWLVCLSVVIPHARQKEAELNTPEGKLITPIPGE